ncbi:MAG: hypothetical protein INR73_25645 [Williamsia sp.]|nr:hypothetical protein [Williamsia sp.]
MEKVKSNLFDLSGKFGKLVFVNNKVHGVSLRLPRGSGKPAVLNDVLQRNADKAKPVTHLAKITYRALSESCGSFRHRDLWQMMLKRMYPIYPAEPLPLLKSLAGLEMHSRYAFSRLQPGLRTEVAIDMDVLQLTLHPQGHPYFQAELLADCYQYHVHLYWLTATREAITTVIQTSGWIASADGCLPVPFSFPLHPEAALLYYFVSTKRWQRQPSD